MGTRWERAICYREQQTAEGFVEPGTGVLMPTKLQPQLEWRFCDEAGTDDDAWTVARMVVADPLPADQANARGQR